MMQYIVKTSVN